MVELPLSPSSNNLFASVRSRRTGSIVRVKSKEYKAWLEIAVLLLKIGHRKIKAKPFQASYTVFGGDELNLARDLSNFEKALGDSAVTAGVIPGDSIRAGLWKVTMEYVPRIPCDKGKACVQVEFSELYLADRPEAK